MLPNILIGRTRYLDRWIGNSANPRRTSSRGWLRFRDRDSVAAIQTDDQQTSDGTRTRTFRNRALSNSLETKESAEYHGASATHLGEVAERPIAPVLKTGDGVTRPRVRIPASPHRKVRFRKCLFFRCLRKRLFWHSAIVPRLCQILADFRIPQSLVVMIVSRPPVQHQTTGW